MNQGILYGVGVGPGDPELMTLKAVRILRQADIIAAPESGDGKCTALEIARAHVAGKDIVTCPMPMIRDKQKLAENYDAVAAQLVGYLQAGKTVAFLTLGDPSIYSTFTYVQARVQAQGFAAKLIPAVPSFCAVAATLNVPLCEGDEMLHIIPASHGKTEAGLAYAGNKVFMKAGRAIGALRETLAENDLLQHAAMVEQCGMAGERVYPSLADAADDAGYFSVVLVKEKKL